MTRRRPIRLVQRVDYLLECARNRSVLHLGCANAPYTAQALADGSLLHLRLRDVAAELHGVDTDRDGLRELAAHGLPHLYTGDVASFSRANHTRFDVVIAGEIIEHLGNPHDFLVDVKRVMSAETTLIVTTVNAYCGFRFAQYALRGRGGTQEPVHPDHVAYYSQATLRRLVTRAGLAVTETLFYDLGREHYPYTRRALRVLNHIATRCSPQLADGVIVACRLPD